MLLCERMQGIASFPAQTGDLILCRTDDTVRYGVSVPFYRSFLPIGRGDRIGTYTLIQGYWPVEVGGIPAQVFPVVSVPRDG